MTSFQRSTGRVSVARQFSRRPSRRRGRAAALACVTLLGVPGTVFLAAPASAAPLIPTPVPVAPAVSARAAASTPAGSSLQSAVQAAVAAGASGYLARVDDGKRVTTAVAGLADRATGRRLRADDQFEVGSNTKTFMSALTLQLVARDELSLDDTVEKILPDVVPNGDRITVRMLLQHTSGLFNYTEDEKFFKEVLADPQREWTPRELVDTATAHKPNFAPGASWSYSNTNYILIGMILQEVTGHSPADLLEHRIARPLGLQHTYLVTDAAEDTGPGYAHGYLLTLTGAKPTYTDTSDWALGGWANTAGAVVSTPSDLARFFEALLGGKVVPAEQLAEMRRTVPFPASFGAKGGYGLGLMRLETPCGTVWGHGGDTVGHHSTAVVTGDGSRSTVADATTQLDPRVPPDAAAVKVATAISIADATAVCRMFDKPLPASAAAAIASAARKAAA